MRLVNNQIFPSISAAQVGGDAVSVPESYAGKWLVVLAYRGHW